MPGTLSARNGYIDQWRGISVLMVILSHLLLYRYHPSIEVTSLTTRTAHKLLWLLDLWTANLGMLGVHIFFVISGYLITNLMLREEANYGRVSLAAFYIRRSFRIIPPLLAYVAGVYLVSALSFTHVSGRDAIVALAYVCNSSYFECAGQFHQLWSLAVEEQFYLCWPLLFLIFRRHRVQLVTLTLLLGAAATVTPQLQVRGWLNNGLAVYCLSIGALFAMSVRFRSAFRPCAAVPWWAFSAILVFLLPCAITRWVELRPAGLLILPWLITAAVIARSEDATAPVHEMLRQVGLVSYSLYLWHVIAMWPQQLYLSHWFFLFSPVLIGMAWVSFHLLERPLTHIGHRISKTVITREGQRASEATRIV